MDLENTVKPLETVNNIINFLSNDEDVRQDLWVSYLSGSPKESLETCLVNIKTEHEQHVAFQNALWNFIKNPPSEKLSNIIQNNFTEYERSIIFLLMLGFSSTQISNIKGISEVRIEQSLATIRYNSVWEEIYGS